MKKLFFMLALLASGFWGRTAQAQDVYQVTDTTVTTVFIRLWPTVSMVTPSLL